MTDISKCSGEGCPLRESCYRYTAHADPIYQAYFTEVPYDPVTGNCDHHWGIRSEAKTVKKKTIGGRNLPVPEPLTADDNHVIPMTKEVSDAHRKHKLRIHRKKDVGTR